MKILQSIVLITFLCMLEARAMDNGWTGHGMRLAADEVPPLIDKLSDLKSKTPVDFLKILKERKFPEYFFRDSLASWISKKDIPGLVALVGSKETCASVALLRSSNYSTEASTVGREALFMLEGYRQGKYPSRLNSIFFDGNKKSNTELIQWCLAEAKK